ncbi:MAG: hypothetical protein QOK40_182 [Miltoncostaeaceae bacterium]|jgi:hypothetical protein|nr:hypothetical protein [Miltoncostaeaceae bacterium]
MLAVASSLAAAAPAVGPEPSCQPSETPSAQLVAAGNGTITLQGKVVVFGVIRSGRGVLNVSDSAGDAVVTVKGERQAVPAGGQLRVHPRHSRFYVVGTCLSIRIRGQQMVIAAGVSGQAAVRGVGAYTVNAGPGRRWSRSTSAVRLVAPAA